MPSYVFDVVMPDDRSESALHLEGKGNTRRPMLHVAALIQVDRHEPMPHLCGFSRDACYDRCGS